ncbi:hypothetical protein ACSSS7_007461 [Eimeria intestinalis]
MQNDLVRQERVMGKQHLLLRGLAHLAMGKGKIAAQCCHAVLGAYRKAQEAVAGVEAWDRMEGPKGPSHPKLENMQRQADWLSRWEGSGEAKIVVKIPVRHQSIAAGAAAAAATAAAVAATAAAVAATATKAAERQRIVEAAIATAPASSPAAAAAANSTSSGSSNSSNSSSSSTSSSKSS